MNNGQYSENDKSKDVPTNSRYKYTILLILIMFPIAIIIYKYYHVESFHKISKKSTNTKEIKKVSPEIDPSNLRLYYSIADYNGINIGDPRLYSILPDGSEQKTIIPHPEIQAYGGFEAISLDGKYVAYTDGTDIYRELYVSELNGKNIIKIDEAYGILDSACFSPDCKKLAYKKWMDDDKKDDTDLYMCNIDGSEKIQLIKTPADKWSICFSNDSSKLIFVQEIKSNIQTMEINLATKKFRPISSTASIPKLNKKYDYNIVTHKTGKKIIIGVDGTSGEYDETVDTLYIINTITKIKKKIAHGFQIKVLGWGNG